MLSKLSPRRARCGSTPAAPHPHERPRPRSSRGREPSSSCSTTAATPAPVRAAGPESTTVSSMARRDQVEHSGRSPTSTPAHDTVEQLPRRGAVRPRRSALPAPASVVRPARRGSG
ncbi:hypothetical protein HBB16_02585 [Pseudonocardia sp. MCCB 268]|nr:hypothetical protein [Pseudonocardia cytotoxica]